MTRDVHAVPAVQGIPAPRSEGPGGHAVDLPTLRQRTSDLLHAHVPLMLLLDLADPDGPDSAGRYALEGGSGDWLAPG